jgi:Xaa-Pro aminopeptidase
MDSTAESLLAAQARAESLFEAVVAGGLMRPGISEAELSRAIDGLARERYGLRRHWHRRIVRSGANTVLTYYDGPSDRVLEDGDLVVLDFGPVFGEWEADYGRTYLVGEDPVKARLIADVEAAFARGKARALADPDITAGQLYDYVVGLAHEYGWQFGASSAGHLIGHFPHERSPGKPGFVIKHGNPVGIHARDAEGRPRHWILEIHFVDRAAGLGAFVEQLLTL